MQHAAAQNLFKIGCIYFAGAQQKKKKNSLDFFYTG